MTNKTPAEQMRKLIESTAVTNESYTTDEKFVDDTFKKMSKNLEYLLRVVGQTSLLRKKINDIGGNTDNFDQIALKLLDISDNLDDLQYEALGHINPED